MKHVCLLVGNHFLNNALILHFRGYSISLYFEGNENDSPPQLNHLRSHSPPPSQAPHSFC